MDDWYSKSTVNRFDFKPYSEYFEITISNKSKWSNCDPLEKTLLNILNKITIDYTDTIAVELSNLLKFLKTININLLKYSVNCIIKRALVDKLFIKCYIKLITRIIEYGGMDYITLTRVLEYQYYLHHRNNNGSDDKTCLMSLMSLLPLPVIIHIFNDQLIIKDYNSACDLIQSLDDNQLAFELLSLMNSDNYNMKIKFRLMDIRDCLKMKN